MGAAYQRRETRESSTGAKLITAYPRALVAENNIAGSVLAAGVSVLIVPVQAALGDLDPSSFILRQNRRYKFSASARLFPANPSQVSLESAGMVISIAGGLPAGFELQTAARLGAITALAYNQAISFDEWDIDANDLIAMNRTAAALLVGGAQNFKLSLQFTLNNVGAASLIGYTTTTSEEVADFDSYRFSKWE
jgi:hypothetical protein